MGDVHDNLTSCRLREVTGLSPTSWRRHRGNWYLTTTQANLPTAEFLVGTGPTNVHWTSCSSSSCSSSRHLIVVIMIIRSSLQINCQAASLTQLHTQPQGPILTAHYQPYRTSCRQFICVHNSRLSHQKPIVWHTFHMYHQHNELQKRLHAF